MIRVPLSALGTTTREDFDLVVQRHAQDLREHAAHQEATLNGDKARVAYPAPWSLKLVDDCIRRPDMVADYEIIDDSPTPEERLRTAKNNLLAKITEAERAAVDTIIPPGKRRLFHMRDAEVRKADMQRTLKIQQDSAQKYHEHQEQFLLKRAFGTAPKVVSQSEAHALAITQREDADAQFMDEHADRVARLEVIARHGAELTHEVEDLADEHACQTWTMKPFPEGVK